MSGIKKSIIIYQKIGNLPTIGLDLLKKRYIVIRISKIFEFYQPKPSQKLQNTTCAEAIKCKCDYVINRTSARNCCLGSDTGWLDIPGHGVGVQEICGSNPRGPPSVSPPFSRVETQGD